MYREVNYFALFFYSDLFNAIRNFHRRSQAERINFSPFPTPVERWVPIPGGRFYMTVPAIVSVREKLKYNLFMLFILRALGSQRASVSDARIVLDLDQRAFFQIAVREQPSPLHRACPNGGVLSGMRYGNYNTGLFYRVASAAGRN